MNLTIDVIGVGRQGDNKIFIQESLTLLTPNISYITCCDWNFSNPE